MPDFIVPVAFFAIAIGLPILCGTIIALAKIIKGGDRKNQTLANSEEVRMLRDIHNGLERLERRIEALETITSERRGRSGSTSQQL